MPSTTASDDYEHWPDDSKYWAKSPTAAQGYDENNGLHSHSYLAGKDTCPAKSPSPAPEECTIEACAEATTIVNPAFYAPQPLYMPQPSSIAHPSNPQFYSAQPQPMYGAFPPQGYYTYAQPGPPVIVAAATSPKPKTPKSTPVAVAMTSAPAPANYHMYTPSFYGAAATVAVVEDPKQPQPNAWQGRTKAQVAEDNMKFAKTEGAYDKRKIAPVGLADDQMCWVIELDGSHTLRSFLTIKDFSGEWKLDPRFEGSYYFVREEEEEKEKK